MEPIFCYRTNKYSYCQAASAGQAATTLGRVPLIIYVVLLLLPLLLSLAGQAQPGPVKSKAYTAIAPAHHHYSELLAIDPTPVAGHASETITFPVQDFRRAVYLNLARSYVKVPVEKFNLMPYPANSSAQTAAELRFLLQLQQERTQADIANTDKMAEIYYDPLVLHPQHEDYKRNINSLFFVGSNSMGPWFNPEQLAVTQRVLHQVMQDATYYIFSLKAQYNRPRPYQLEPMLQQLEAPGHAAYPSGHASASYIHAYLLSIILPEYKEQLLGTAYDMAFSREVRGVHYPSDSEAGRKLAQQFVALLLRSPDFKADFIAMKAEILKAKKQYQLASGKMNKAQY